jgi:peptide/nickel transport system permease protein
MAGVTVDQHSLAVGIDQLDVEPRRGANAWRRGLRIAFRKPLGLFSLVVIAVMVSIAVFAPLAQRYDPVQPWDKENPRYDPTSRDFGSDARHRTISDQKASPSTTHWFGTDDTSRDLWSRIVWGARRSLTVAVLALMIAVGAGAFLGILSGYFGGWFDTGLQRVLDALQAIPPLLLLILAATSLELSLRNLILVLGFVGITQVSRLIRGTVLSLRELPFVEAARVLGAQDARIMLRHILPNTVPTLIVVFTIGLPVVIISEAALTFLGLTPPAPKGSWGEILSDGVNAITESPWQSLFAGGAITLSVLAFNLAGDALRDVLDPRLRV